MTPEEIKARHDQSVKDYPLIHLTDNEYVIAEVSRHPIGLFAPFIGGVVLIGIAFALLFNYDAFVSTLRLSGDLANPGNLILPIILFTALVVLIMYVSYYIYTRNSLILTNECIIQNIQYSLISRREQSISLGSIEDGSFTQRGILQYILNYGSIRLSTVGSEQTYRFTFVTNPKEESVRLNDAVEAYKNGRPIPN